MLVTEALGVTVSSSCSTEVQGRPWAVFMWKDTSLAREGDPGRGKTENVSDESGRDATVCVGCLLLHDSFHGYTQHLSGSASQGLSTASQGPLLRRHV